MQTSASSHIVYQNKKLLQSIVAVWCLLLTSMVCGHFSVTYCHPTYVAQRKRHHQRLLRSTLIHTPIADAPCRRRHLVSSINIWQLRPEHLLGVVERWCSTTAAAAAANGCGWWRCIALNSPPFRHRLVVLNISFRKHTHSDAHYHVWLERG